MKFQTALWRGNDAELVCGNVVKSGYEIELDNAMQNINETITKLWDETKIEYFLVLDREINLELVDKDGDDVVYEIEVDTTPYPCRLNTAVFFRAVVTSSSV